MSGWGEFWGRSKWVKMDWVVPRDAELNGLQDGGERCLLQGRIKMFWGFKVKNGEISLFGGSP